MLRYWRTTLKRVVPNHDRCLTRSLCNSGALTVRRRQLIGMIVAEKNHLATAAKQLRKEIAAHIDYLQRALGRADQDLDQFIQHNSAFNETEQLLRTTPSIGPITSRTLLAELPEI